MFSTEKFSKGQKVSFDLGISRKEGRIVDLNSKTVWVVSEGEADNPVKIKRHIVKHRVRQG